MSPVSSKAKLDLPSLELKELNGERQRRTLTLGSDGVVRGWIAVMSGWRKRLRLSTDSQHGRCLTRALRLAVFSLGLIIPTGASAWWNGDWSIRKKITIDTSATGTVIKQPSGPAAILLRLHDGNFQFASARDDGTDLRFLAADDKTLLPYHIEKYDSLLNEAFVWVKIPEIAPGGKTSFWLYYGNSGNSVSRIDNSKATYDPETVLVYHFNGEPPVDVTSYENNAKTAAIAVEGSLIGNGARFDGQNNITLPDSPSLAWPEGAAFTWSAWINAAESQPNAAIYSRRDNGSSVIIGLDSGIPYVEVTAPGGVSTRTPAGSPWTPKSWHHLAVVAAGSVITVFVDGESYATLNASVPAMSAAPILGGDPNGTGFKGEIDELEISKVGRPPGYIKLIASNQGASDTSKLLAFAEDEQTSSWFSGGYFGVILKSVTPDGWVVIGILILMGLFSWFVMFNRLAYLNRVSKGNDRFLREWNHISKDLTSLDSASEQDIKSLDSRFDKISGRAIARAAIYRIYRIGADEIRHRMSGVGPKVLSASSIEAIRASLDGGLVRETQKLNNLMVFLTLAISGGPFLGLLGTVVGVMITFAAIAAAGDVNVNSIAPGIAAALVATVAGLAVAIPSLFGYNYLLTRIKSMTSDMQVFIDEFITKMAEFYSTKPDELVRE
jgi:biopolymer transport protein ExbB